MTRTTCDIVVVGGANTDFLVRGPALPKPGETIDGDVFQQAAGGKGANQAVAAARLGARVLFIAKLGQDDRGDELAAQLAAENVDTKFIVRDQQVPTGVAVIMVNEEGQKQIMTAPGANHSLTAADVEAAADAIRDAKVVLAQLEVPDEAVRAAFRLARQAGAKVVFDPAPARSLPDDILRLVDVIKPNAAEAGVLTGVTVTDRRTARQAANKLLQRGVGAVAVQAGGEGSLLVAADEEIWLPKIPVDSVDATGAGDAFAAAMAVMLCEGSSLEEAGWFASAAAALSTTVVGAQGGLPRREAVNELLAHSRTGR